MTYKVGISGASGRVGTEIAKILSSGIDGLERGDETADVWIDFSAPEATQQLLSRIQAPVVIGSTGFDKSEREKIEAYSKRFPVLLASNMSPGVNVMLGLLSRLPNSKQFPCSAVLEESHHRHKKDAPSGTALTLLETLKGRGFENVDVHVTRAGEIRGFHSVRLINDDEEIVISHRVENRTVFARGALMAASFLVKQKTPRMYSMAEVFSPEENIL